MRRQMKFNLNSLCIASLLSCTALLLPNYSEAAPGQDAGSVLTKPGGSPHASFEPSKDITGFMDYNKNKTEEENPDIYFSADEIENNNEIETIIAKGNVNIIRDNLTLIADKVIYNQRDDVVTAVGNVVMVEKDGSVVFSDFVELKDKMSVGEMKNIKVIMQDETRMAARSARRTAGDKKFLNNVVYSPCDACRDSDPLWQLKARKVEHNPETKNVNYNDAYLEIKGVPVFYTPFFSHPDPTVKRRSGFLPPTISTNSYLGASIQPKYFWNISDNEGMLFNPILSTDKGIVYSGAYDKYFYRGDLQVSGSFLRDNDEKENRGNLFLTGRYEVNDFWLADTDINYASDSSYLKDLSLPKKDDAWLTSTARLQGFDNRNYASIETFYYKLISYDLKDYDKPQVLPLMSYENISDVNKYGAYNKNTFDFASVYRDTATSTQRFSMINSWNLPYTSPYGEKYKLAASVKSDLYYVDDYTYNDQNFDGATGRIFPQLGVEWRFPFVKATNTSRHIVEPVVVAVAAPNSSNKVDKIPNEDSQDVELDDTNILSLDRYSGYDRNDTGSRVSYGINWSSYGERYGRTSFFIAQSYKFSKDESFTSVTGNNDSNFTDYVGRAYLSPSEFFDLTYRFKLDKNNMDLTYSELATRVGPNMLNVYISYIFLQENQESSLINDEQRKELYTSLNAALTQYWSVSVYNRQDLTSNGGSLEHGGSLIYEDECLKLITNIHKDNSSDPNYKGDFEASFTFFLKTLGGAGSK